MHLPLKKLKIVMHGHLEKVHLWKCVGITVAPFVCELTGAVTMISTRGVVVAKCFIYVCLSVYDSQMSFIVIGVCG